MESNRCPVCNKHDLEAFDICPSCGWENDTVQLCDPDFSGGANRMSLNEAKKAYKEGKVVE